MTKKTLALVELIKEAHENDEFFDAVIWSTAVKGVGKSVYALLLLRTVYKSWDEAFKHIWFSPSAFVKQMKYNLDNDIRTPLEIFDDASMHLSKREWNKRNVRLVGRIYNAIRECTSAMLFTSPNWDDISLDIREEVKCYAEVMKDEKEPDLLRIVRFYKAVRGIWLRNIYPKIGEDYFHLSDIPKEYYEYYRELKKYALKCLFVSGMDNGKLDGLDLSKISSEHIIKKTGIRWRELGAILRRHGISLDSVNISPILNEINQLVAEKWITFFERNPTTLYNIINKAKLEVRMQ